jgi:acetyl esterase
MRRTHADDINRALLAFLFQARRSECWQSSSTCTEAAGCSATLARTIGSCASSRSALLSVECPNSPEARCPVAIEYGYAAARRALREGATKGLDTGRMAVAGESVGGDMAAALTLMAKKRGDVTFAHASMYHAVTGAGTDTASGAAAL